MFHWLIPKSRRVSRKEDGLRPLAELTKKDCYFDAGDLQARISNLTIQLLYGLCDGNMAPLQPYVTPALYQRLTRDARRYLDRQQRLNIVRPCVLRCEALGYKQIEDDIRIIFRVQTRMTRYVTNERREIVQGHRRNEIFELKTWELCRSSSIKTEAPPELDDTPCPSCGGPVNTYASAICPRCGTAVRMERYEWIVSSIE